MPVYETDHTTSARELLTLLAETAFDLSCALRDPISVACSEDALISRSYHQRAREFLDGLDPDDALTWAFALPDGQAQAAIEAAALRHGGELGCPLCGLGLLPFDEDTLEDLPEPVLEYLPPPTPASWDLGSFIALALGV